MNIRDLEYVEAVANHRNFSRAALACNVSQPGLSSQIKKLEQELGVDIFDRRGSQVELTSFGKQILASANQIIKQAKKIKETAIQFQDLDMYPFKIGMTPTLAPYLSTYFRTMLTDLYPKMRCVLVEDKPRELAAMVESRDIDAALLANKSYETVIESQKEAVLNFTPMWREPIYLGVSEQNPLAVQSDIWARDVPADKLIRFNIPFGYDLERDLPDVYGDERRNTVFDVSAARFETVCRHVSQSEDCTIINAVAGEQFKRDNWGLAFISFKDNGNVRELGLVSRIGYPRGKILEKIEEYVGDFLPVGTLPLAVGKPDTGRQAEEKPVVSI